MRIAALGPRGTYSAHAAEQYNSSAELMLTGSITEAIETVSSGDAERGVLPFENSIEGMVNETLDNLYRSDLVIVDQREQDIHHALCSSIPELPEKADVIYSHPQALAQCRRFIRSKFPDVQSQAVASTAKGMQLLTMQPSSRALAIGPEFAAARYGLHVLEQTIEDEPNNQTKFVVVAKEAVESCVDYSLLALVPRSDRPGRLYDILGIMKDREINLSQIESRPQKVGLGKYMFYLTLDMPGHDERLEPIIEEISAHDVDVRCMTA